ncbi:hypothetical protein GWK47_014703 [Chionoecetes opilio]|uniref:Uncharacterized protein n=1 Tax=Chionoecetes opilio TaxID=41210 RepID=A0A8J5CIN8_CHIOP|nr:hypothetical protein GWK47_014703 [Chionoecetes opilio]
MGPLPQRHSGRFGKGTCGLPPTVTGLTVSVCSGQVRSTSALHSPFWTPRVDSVRSNYDVIRAHSYKYRRRGLMVRRHNVVSARLRLGWCGKLLTYIPIDYLLWPRSLTLHPANCVMHPLPTLWHLHCHVVRDMLPRGLPLTEICRFLLVHDNLDTILVRHQRFGGC